MLNLYGLIDWRNLITPFVTRNILKFIEQLGKPHAVGYTDVYVWIFRVARIQRTKPWVFED